MAGRKSDPARKNSRKFYLKPKIMGDSTIEKSPYIGSTLSAITVNLNQIDYRVCIVNKPPQKVPLRWQELNLIQYLTRGVRSRAISLIWLITFLYPNAIAPLNPILFQNFLGFAFRNCLDIPNRKKRPKAQSLFLVKGRASLFSIN